MPVMLRQARVDDLSLLRGWDDQPHVVASDPNDDWQWETELTRDPAWREQLIAELDGRPIGFVQIIDPQEEESHYWGACGPSLRAIDIWIGAQDDLGKGYGTQMMKLALARCFAPPEVEAVLVDPLENNKAAHRFYQRLGFVPVGPRRLGEDDCLVFRLERVDWLSDGREGE